MTPAGIGPTGRLSSLYVLQGKLNFSFLSDLYLLAEEWENEAGTHLARPAFENPADKSPLPSSWPTKVTFWGRGHNWAKGVCSGVTADPTCASAYADPMSGMLFSLWNLIPPPSGLSPRLPLLWDFPWGCQPSGHSSQTPVSSGHNLALNYFLSFTAFFPRFQRLL